MDSGVTSDRGVTLDNRVTSDSGVTSDSLVTSDSGVTSDSRVPSVGWGNMLQINTKRLQIGSNLNLKIMNRLKL